MSGRLAATETDYPQTRRAPYTVVARSDWLMTSPRRSRLLFALAGFSLATAGTAWLGFRHRPAKQSRA
jgi:hypothetical protein